MTRDSHLGLASTDNKRHSSTISDLRGESSFNDNIVDNEFDELWRIHVDKGLFINDVIIFGEYRI